MGLMGRDGGCGFCRRSGCRRSGSGLRIADSNRPTRLRRLDDLNDFCAQCYTVTYTASPASASVPSTSQPVQPPQTFSALTLGRTSDALHVYRRRIEKALDVAIADVTAGREVPAHPAPDRLHDGEYANVSMTERSTSRHQGTAQPCSAPQRMRCGRPTKLVRVVVEGAALRPRQRRGRRLLQGSAADRRRAPGVRSPIGVSAH